MDDQLNTKPKNNAKFVAIPSFIILLAMFGIYSYKHTSSKNPISEYSESLKFSVYYPKSSKYKFVEGSAYLSNGILVYRISDSGNVISITQQETSLQNKSIRIEGYNNIATPIGTMFLGQLEDKSNAVITTSTSIISINSLGDSSQEDLQYLTLSFQKIN